MLKKLAVGGAAVAIGASVWGVAGEDHTTRDTSGSIVQAGQLGAFVTRVGDCFESLPVDANSVSTIQAVPCSQPHHWQTFYKGDIYLSEFSEEGTQSAADTLCANALNSMASTLSDGKIQEYRNAEISYLTPTTESWAKEDRTVDCLVGNDNELYFTSFIA